MKRLVVKNKEEIGRQITDYLMESSEYRFIHRLHTILLFIKKSDETCESLGSLYGCSPRTISNWIKKLNNSGDLESLREEKRPGRTSRLNAVQMSELKEAIQKPPQQSGMTSNGWDGKTLSAYVSKKYGVSLKTRTCQTVLQKLNFKKSKKISAIK